MSKRLLTCNDCGTDLIPGSKKEGGNWPKSAQDSRNYMCRDCRTKYNNGWRERSSPRDAVPTCSTCGTVLIPGLVSEGGNWPPSRQPRHTICTPCISKLQTPEYQAAAYRAHKERHPEEYLEHHRKSKAKRRTLLKTNGPVDNINWRSVWGRDEGHCRVGLRCNFDFVPFEEMELEHVIPLSKGGTHTWNNVQTSCSPCNRSKSNKPPMFQAV